MISDALYFLRTVKCDVFRQSSLDPSCYWENCSREELEHIITLLSNPNDPERVKIRSILKELKPKSLLDIACGSATELEGYKQEGIELEYTGADKSKRMLAIARTRFPQAQFYDASITQLPFTRSSYDCVLLKHILEHLETYPRAVEEAVHIAREHVIINFFHRLTPFPFDIPVKRKEGNYDNWYSRSRFERFLRTLAISDYNVHFVRGIHGQTAMIYVLEK